MRNSLWQRGQKKFRAVGFKSQIKLFTLLSSKVDHFSTSVTPKYFIKVCNAQISHPSKLPAVSTLMKLKALTSRAGLRSRRPSAPAPCRWASHLYGLRSCSVISRQSWASCLVAAVDAVPGQALGQEGGGKERPAGQPSLGKGQRSDLTMKAPLPSQSLNFPFENSDLSYPC